MDKILNLPVTNRHLWETHEWFCDDDENIQHILIKNKYEIFVMKIKNTFELFLRVNQFTGNAQYLNSNMEGIEIRWNGNPFKLRYAYDNYYIDKR